MSEAPLQIREGAWFYPFKSLKDLQPITIDRQLRWEFEPIASREIEFREIKGFIDIDGHAAALLPGEDPDDLLRQLEEVDTPLGNVSIEIRLIDGEIRMVQLPATLGTSLIVTSADQCRTAHSYEAELDLGGRLYSFKLTLDDLEAELQTIAEDGQIEITTPNYPAFEGFRDSHGRECGILLPCDYEKLEATLGVFGRIRMRFVERQLDQNTQFT